MNLTNSKYINLIRLLHNEHRSLDELIHIQTLGLRKLVKHSYDTVKFYKKLFDDCGLQPGDIQSLDDIAKIPIIDKQTLQQNLFDNLISEDYKRKNLIPVETSGSSGVPLEFFIDNSFDQFRKAQFLRPYITNGRRIWDKVLTFSTRRPFNKKWFHYLGIISDYKVYSGENIYTQIDAIKKIRPAIIQGYSSALNLIACKIMEENISLPVPHLIFTDSELLTADKRKNIESAFGSKIIDIYGTFETDNIAYECHKHNGYHIAIDCVVMEFIQNSKPVNPNEEGEIVVTILNNFAMPFIRYNLHDLGSYNKEPCTCGRTFPIMKGIQGRDSDYMFTKDGMKFSFLSLSPFWERLAKLVYEYQVIQENINDFTVLIVPNRSFNNEANKIVLSAFEENFQDARINIKLVPTIEREKSGKFKAFKSKVENLL